MRSRRSTPPSYDAAPAVRRPAGRGRRRPRRSTRGRSGRVARSPHPWVGPCASLRPLLQIRTSTRADSGVTTSRKSCPQACGDRSARARRRATSRGRLSRCRRPGRSGRRTSARAASRACVRLAPNRTVTASPRRERADLAPVDEHDRRTSGVRLTTSSSKPGPDDERAGVQRVRRDEREHRRLEAPHEHRAAVREVVGGRPGRRRAEQRRRTAGCRGPRRRSRTGARRSARGAADDDCVVDGRAGARRRPRPRASAATRPRTRPRTRARARSRARRPGSRSGSRPGRSWRRSPARRCRGTA